MSEPLTDAIDTAIEVLNRVHDADPSVLPTLINYRVPCNEAVADDPTVQVGEYEGITKVGLLGIVNGLFGTIPGRKSGWIGAYHDDEGSLVKFARLYPTLPPSPSDPQEPTP